MSDAFKRLDDIPNSVAEKTYADNKGDPQAQYPKAKYWNSFSLFKEDEFQYFALGYWA